MLPLIKAQKGQRQADRQTDRHTNRQTTEIDQSDKRNVGVFLQAN